MNDKEKDKDKDKDKEKDQIIYVNTRIVPYQEKEITFRQVVLIAFPDAQFLPNLIYTVKYSKGIDKKPKGTLVDNESVHVKNGMVFDVDRTDNS